MIAAIPALDHGLIYEVQPGHAEGVETCHLERTREGVRVVLNMGGVVYRNKSYFPVHGT